MSVGKSQRRSGTDIEVALRKALRGENLHGYRLNHRITLPVYRGRPQHSTPDVTFIGHRIAVFADGCFFHGHLKEGSNLSKAEWRLKQARARARDQRLSRALVVAGWRVVRFWGCEDPRAVAKAIKALIDVGAPPDVYGLPEETQ